MTSDSACCTLYDFVTSDSACSVTDPSTDTCVSSADKSAMDDPANKEFKHLLDVLRKENIQLQPGMADLILST